METNQRQARTSAYKMTKAGSITPEERQKYVADVRAVKAAKVAGFFSSFKTAMSQSGVVSGAVMLDWWETGLTYSALCLVIALMGYGATKQIQIAVAILQQAVLPTSSLP